MGEHWYVRNSDAEKFIIYYKPRPHGVRGPDRKKRKSRKVSLFSASKANLQNKKLWAELLK